MLLKTYRPIGYIYVLLNLGCMGCTKLVQVPEPVNTITNEETFGSDATATSAVIEIYNDLLTGHVGRGSELSFANGLLSVDAGMSADELHIFNGPSSFETTTLNASNFPSYPLWNGPYFDIYMTNAVITGLQSSDGVSAGAKQQLTGEAKFLRAFCYFYLVNLFGDVPLAMTTAYAVTDTLHRAPAAQVYQQMISDLKDAQQLLPSDDAVSGNTRTRANKWAATALLARAYLYQQQWDSAEAVASLVITHSGVYSLTPDPNNVFLYNSQETILQWQTANLDPYATVEGGTFIPYDNTSRPDYYFTASLLGSFEAGDLRRKDWVDTSSYLDSNYYYPYKYKVRRGTTDNITENCVVLRLAELYLVRAEARTKKPAADLGGAIADLNIIRRRAGLSDLSSSLTQPQVLSAVMQERRVELFAEWGHRWLDLKRTGQADVVLAPPVKPNWKSSAQLYPIPAGELLDDPNLVQNTGY